MNRTIILKLLVMGFIVTFTAVGCKKQPIHPTPIPGVTRQPPKPVSPIGPATGSDNTGLIPPNVDPRSNPLPLDPTGVTTQSPRVSRSDFNEDREVFKDQTVYFDFDSSAVKAADKAKIDSVAEYLKGQPTMRLVVEGHCDERGTEEYNRALGDRRALSVREYLIAVGIAGDRISSDSLGEDKPAVLGHDETAWAKNRRGEFILLKPKTP